jgi:hypothetical protein
MGLKARVGQGDVSNDIGVANDEIVFGASFVELLLGRKPGSLVEPKLDLGYLLSHVF